MNTRFKQLRWACWERLARIIARSYIVGPKLDDALETSRRLAPSQIPTTICYWNTEDESPQQVTAAYVDAINALSLLPSSRAPACHTSSAFKEYDPAPIRNGSRGRQAGSEYYLSIKAPALRFDRSCFRQVVEAAKKNNICLHFDSLGPEAADETFAMIEETLPTYRELGCTLPGRWRRSIADADWAAQRDLQVRVVKGQWADPLKPETDFRQGFLAVIDRLAGRARHVAVATHDATLAQEALSRLQKSNTSCELELLYGLPLEPARQTARTAGVSVRLYLPYGHGWLPYSISQAKKNPRIFWWVIKDLLRPSRVPGLMSRVPPSD